MQVPAAQPGDSRSGRGACGSPAEEPVQAGSPPDSSDDEDGSKAVAAALWAEEQPPAPDLWLAAAAAAVAAGQEDGSAQPLSARSLRAAARGELRAAHAALGAALRRTECAAVASEAAETAAAAAQRRAGSALLKRSAAGAEQVAGRLLLARYWQALRRRRERRVRLRGLAFWAEGAARCSDRANMQKAWALLNANRMLGRARMLCALAEPPQQQPAGRCSSELCRPLSAASCPRSSMMTAVSVPDDGAVSEAMSDCWAALNAIQRVVRSHCPTPMAQDECRAAVRGAEAAVSACEVRMQEQQQACGSLLRMGAVFESGVWAKTQELAARDRAVRELQEHIALLETELFRRVHKLQNQSCTQDAAVQTDPAPGPETGRQPAPARHRREAAPQAAPKEAAPAGGCPAALQAAAGEGSPSSPADAARPPASGLSAYRLRMLQRQTQ